MAFHALERLMNLYDGYHRCFNVAGKSLLLVQDEGRCYLLLHQCPHQQAPLTKSTLSHGQLRCPIHGMSFSLSTGKTEDGCNQSLKFLRIAYEGNQLGVEL